MGKSGKEREAGGERAPTVRAPIGSILRLRVAAKMRLVNQKIEGVGHYSVLLFGDRHGHVIKSFSRKFKMALNNTYRIFLNFAKNCAQSCL